MITADYHVHSAFSSDSKSPIDNMIRRGIDIGLETICFTDHMDYDFPKEYNMLFEFDPQEYFHTIKKLADKYKEKIEILAGVELGMQPHIANKCNDLIEKYPFDFVICSSHLLNQKDPYYPDFWTGMTEKEGYRKYFESILNNIKAFHNFDVYGHLDYIVRYGPNHTKDYLYSDYKDIIDEILKNLLSLNKGIEINSAGLKYGLGFAHPKIDILKRYHELGGEIITIGSDGHCPEHLAYDFDKVKNILLEAGFKFYCVYKERTPAFIKL